MKGEILFRPAALAALQTPEQLGGSLRAVRPAALLALAVLGLVFAVLLAASFVVTVPIQVRSDAILISSKGMLELSITAQQEGRAVEILVGPRDRVAPGDVVARIEQPQLRLELAQAEAERDQLADSMEDINRLQVETAQASKNIRDQMRAQAETSSRFLEERLKALTALSKSVEDLRTRGIVNVERLLTLRSDLADAQERLSSKEAAPLSLLIEELNQKGLFRREQLQLQERLAAVQHRISRITNQLKRESAVVSRDYGVVSEVKVTRGDLVKFDTAVVSMLPNSDTLYRERPGPSRLIAAAFIPAQSGKKVRPGMSALVDPLSVRRDVYGGMIGTVIDVSDVPLTRERMLQLLRNEELVKRLTASGAPFLVHVALKADRSLPSGFAWTASSGPPTPVTSGTLAEVQITTERAALITLVIPALKELARGFGRNEERGDLR